MSARFPLVAVYADESCLGNVREKASPGGAGGLIEYQRADGTVQRFDFWVSDPATTNNRMALQSVIETFGALSRKGAHLSVRFTTDSRYIVDGMTDWVHGWVSRGWVRKGGAIENLDLWRRAVDTARDGGHEIEWRWVRGHAGHAQNEYANHLATRAAAALDTSGGLVPSGFDAWYEARAGSVTKLAEPDPFPSADAFHPSRSLPRSAATRPRP
ncbi:MAG: ribonuclease HI [Gemmatimonadaceae bacterium]|nr:ribonuclease HI [Gemmatimonadaceae bacterium]